MTDTFPVQPLEQQLERCLQDLARTGDVEVSLRRYPQYADQLRPLVEIAQATRRYYTTVPQAPGGLKAGRERFLATAAQQRARNLSVRSEAGVTATRTTRGRKKRLAFAMRLVGALLAIVMGTVSLGGGIVWAANASLPGDLLYPVKTTVEDARLALVSAPEHQVGLALQFAEERVEEIQTLAEAGRQVPNVATARLERHIEQALVQAAWVPAEKMDSILDQIARRTRTQTQVLEQKQTQVASTASQQVRVALEQAVAVCRRGAEVAQAGLRDPQAFRQHYRYQPGTPRPADEEWLVTITPGVDQRRDQEQRQERGQEPTSTPVSGPHMTPEGPTQGPRVTYKPRNLPQDPQSTTGPQTTPQPKEPAPGPQATSQPQEPAPGPQATSQPQEPPPELQATPQPQEPSSKPQATSQPQEPSPRPQATSQPQEPSPRPQATSQPQQPGPGSPQTPRPGP
jgi:hypothetical protein